MKKLTSWIQKHPDIQKWLNNHPRFTEFAKSRSSTQTFFGLPLTALVLASVGCLYVLVGVIQDYVAHDPLIAADARIANLLFAFRSVPGVHLLYALTNFASPATGVVVVGLLAAAWFWRKQRTRAMVAISGLVATEGVTLALKLLFHRTRPDLILRAIAEDSYSLPSGHATTAAFVFGYLGYVSLLRFGSKWQRLSIVVVVMLAVVVIDFSRLYLGVHYLSDVVAGNAVGFLGLFLTIGIDQWLIAKKKNSQNVLPAQVIWVTMATSVLIAAAMFVTNKSPWTTPVPPTTTTVASNDVLELFTNGTLPRRTETLIGEAQEPISLILVVPDNCLASDMAKAGWTFATPIEPSSVFLIAKAALFNDEYLSAPMTPSFYDEHPHDFGFEKPTSANSVRERHHARFWLTPYQTTEGRVIVGTASLDTGIKWGVTHSIAPDIDTERDTLVADLTNAGVITSQQTIRHFVSPVLGQNFTTDFFFTNGDAVLLTLSSCQ